VREGVIAADSHLLQPHFYIVPGLEAWLRESVRQWMADRPHWII
jgi:hypothetical protein